MGRKNVLGTSIYVYTEPMKKGLVNVEQHSSIGILWVIGWLFSIGFLNLSFWWGVLAIIIWPYLLGVHFTG